jgi:hypothetical protein
MGQANLFRASLLKKLAVVYDLSESCCGRAMETVRELTKNKRPPMKDVIRGLWKTQQARET